MSGQIGPRGLDGEDGQSGGSGVSGSSGGSGTSGASGGSGTSGTGGSAGASGTSGQTGGTGTSGTSGSAAQQSGTSGTPGTPGGTSGTSGAQGPRGLDGEDGTDGQDGLGYKQTVAISSNTLTVDYNLGRIVYVSLTANINTLTINNWPASGIFGKLSLRFTADGTQRTITYPAAAKWGRRDDASAAADERTSALDPPLLRGRPHDDRWVLRSSKQLLTGCNTTTSLRTALTSTKASCAPILQSLGH
jgi:hypothetical protein